MRKLRENEEKAIMLQKYRQTKSQGRKSLYLRIVVVFASMILIGSFASAVFAQNAGRGELLYWNHCGTCHDESVHTREERRAESIEEVYIWVLAWTVHNGLDWEVEDVEDVTQFLTRYLYEFED